jgi:mono/diheme cytochrome c family protein/plastocyanin
MKTRYLYPLIALLSITAGLVAVPLLVWASARLNAPPARVIHVTAQMAETGGWSPANLTATVGEPLELQFTSHDMAHSFAVGQMDVAPVAIVPGKSSRASLVFTRPGKYVFYCTEWCGSSHWRMRGTIEVSGNGEPISSGGEPPLYVILGVDLDADRPAVVAPEQQPSANRGRMLRAALPSPYLLADDYRSQSPAEVWSALRDETATAALSDSQVWDLVAYLWQRNTDPAALATGEALYTTNCAACHGNGGAGDGPMAAIAAPNGPTVETGHGPQAPANFADPTRMLSASPALLQGKIIRGGMGTGMPYWGPIFTDEQTWALVDYLYTFQFDLRR